MSNSDDHAARRSHDTGAREPDQHGPLSEALALLDQRRDLLRREFRTLGRAAVALERVALEEEKKAEEVEKDRSRVAWTEETAFGVQVDWPARARDLDALARQADRHLLGLAWRLEPNDLLAGQRGEKAWRLEVEGTGEREEFVDAVVRMLRTASARTGFPAPVAAPGPPGCSRRSGSAEAGT